MLYYNRHDFQATRSFMEWGDKLAIAAWRKALKFIDNKETGASLSLTDCVDFEHF
jgi:hypothetical protein